jgi:hypothetical protein
MTISTKDDQDKECGGDDDISCQHCGRKSDGRRRAVVVVAMLILLLLEKEEGGVVDFDGGRWAHSR